MNKWQETSAYIRRISNSDGEMSRILEELLAGHGPADPKQTVVEDGPRGCHLTHAEWMKYAPGRVKISPSVQLAVYTIIKQAKIDRPSEPDRSNLTFEDVFTLLVWQGYARIVLSNT